VIPRCRPRDPMSSQRQDEPPRLKRPDEIDEVFGRGNPNPDRIGCPPHDVLVALARRERPIDPPTIIFLNVRLAISRPCVEGICGFSVVDFLLGRGCRPRLTTGSASWLLLSRGTSGGPIVADVRTSWISGHAPHARRDAAGRSTSSFCRGWRAAACSSLPLRARACELRSGTRARREGVGAG
jgi:hypothetical protein